MKVIKMDDVEVKEATSKIFEGGKVTDQRIIDESIAKEMRVIVVNFSAGAKNKLHTHTFEQILLVTDGKGIVATEKEEHVVTQGTIVYIPAGELHWHGATEDSSFSHIAISTPGQTTF